MSDGLHTEMWSWSCSTTKSPYLHTAAQDKLAVGRKDGLHTEMLLCSATESPPLSGLRM